MGSFLQSYGNICVTVKDQGYFISATKCFVTPSYFYIVTINSLLFPRSSELLLHTLYYKKRVHCMYTYTFIDIKCLVLLLTPNVILNDWCGSRIYKYNSSPSGEEKGTLYQSYYFSLKERYVVKFTMDSVEESHRVSFITRHSVDGLPNAQISNVLC